MMEELVRLMLDHWQEHRARRRASSWKGPACTSHSRGTRWQVQPGEHVGWESSRHATYWLAQDGGKYCIAMQGNGCCTKLVFASRRGIRTMRSSCWCKT